MYCSEACRKVLAGEMTDAEWMKVRYPHGAPSDRHVPLIAAESDSDISKEDAEYIIESMNTGYGDFL